MIELPCKVTSIVINESNRLKVNIKADGTTTQRQLFTFSHHKFLYLSEVSVRLLFCSIVPLFSNHCMSLWLNDDDDVPVCEGKKKAAMRKRCSSCVSLNSGLMWGEGGGATASQRRALPLVCI